jgi:DNA-binding NarL/FixJ family response regulator
MNSPRVLVVEDDPRVAALVCAVLERGSFVVLDVAGDALSAEVAVQDHDPDLLLVDLGLPDRDGVDLIRTLRAMSFRGPILVLTSATMPDRVLAALRAGADGYLFKEDLDARLTDALRDLVAGGSPLSARAASALLAELRAEPPRTITPRPSHASLAPALTARERAVLEALSTGGSYAEIARELSIEVNTVRTHIRSLYDKCGVENRAEAVDFAWRVGLLGAPR